MPSFSCVIPDAVVDDNGTVTIGPVVCDGVAPYSYEWHYINSENEDFGLGGEETFIIIPGDDYYANNNKYYVIVTDSLGKTGTSNQITLVLGAPCFIAGTPVLTPNGYRSIETIAKGDLVQTADGRNVPVISTYKQEIGRSNRNTAPFLIPAGSLGPSMPCSDLVMSPDHCLHIGYDMWLPAKRCKTIVEGVEPVRQIHNGKPIVYYNLSLPNYFTDNLVVFGGVEVESMGPRTLVWENSKDACRRNPT